MPESAFSALRRTRSQTLQTPSARRHGPQGPQQLLEIYAGHASEISSSSTQCGKCLCQLYKD